MEKYRVGPHQEVVIRATAEFYVFQVVDGHQVLLGPDNASERYWRRVVKDVMELEVECKGKVFINQVVNPPPFEVPDPRPVEVPLGYGAPPSLEDDIRRMIRVEMSKYAESQGAGSFEEEDDFGEDQEEEFVSEHEMSEMVEEEPYLAEDEPVSPAKPEVAPVVPAPEKPGPPST